MINIITGKKREKIYEKEKEKTTNLLNNTNSIITQDKKS